MIFTAISLNFSSLLLQLPTLTLYRHHLYLELLDFPFHDKHFHQGTNSQVQLLSFWQVRLWFHVC